MRALRHLLPLILLSTGLVSTKGFAQQDRFIGQESTFERRHDETDQKQVREFVQSKENIEIKEKATELEISGDVRFEWRHLHERGNRVFLVEDLERVSGSDGETILVPTRHFIQKNTKLRGGDVIDNRFLPISNNDWDVEANLKFKYTYKKAWAAIHLQFDNPAGIRGYNDCSTDIRVLEAPSRSASFSIPDYTSDVIPSSAFLDSDKGYYYYYPTSSYGSAGSPISSSDAVDSVVIFRDGRFTCKGSGEGAAINLKRAYMGYNIYADGVHRFDVEMGRRKLNDVFDSEIQFSSRFDGIVFKYAGAIDKVMDWYWNAGAFIVDERVNHIAYVLEFGVLGVLDSGLDLKYSFINWPRPGDGKNRCFIKHPWGSQFRNSQFTFSYHANPEIYCKTIPVEFYGAFIINHAAKRTIFTKHKKKNLGWYLGILFGEVDKEGDWSFDITYECVQAQMASDCDVDGIGRGNIFDERITDILNIPGTNEYLIPRRGNGNFEGWSFEALYALTDNLSFNLIFEFTKAEDRRIGGRHRYTNAEIVAIYAF
jgi:hypothetical protein